jgi:hypothetical protein
MRIFSFVDGVVNADDLGAQVSTPNRRAGRGGRGLLFKKRRFLRQQCVRQLQTPRHPSLQRPLPLRHPW